MSFLGTVVAGLAGRPGKASTPNVPDFYTDPSFDAVQKFMQTYGQDILKGNIPDFYKSIGSTVEPGTMDDYISSSVKDLLNKSMEEKAITGRGGSLGSDTLSAIGNMSANLRFSDFLRAQEGKQWLMNTGLGVETDVRDAGAWNQNQRNAFNQWQYGAKFANENYLQNRRDMRKLYDSTLIANSDAAFWNDVSSGFSGLSQMYGGGGGGGAGGGGGVGMGGIFGGIATATKGYMNNPYNDRSYWGSPSSINTNKAETKNNGLDFNSILQIAKLLQGSGGGGGGIGWGINGNA